MISEVVDSALGVFVGLFFSNVDIVGADNCVHDGGVVYVGNHNNQFIDGILLRRCVASVCDRKPKFLVAQKSYDRPIIGHLAKMLSCIPVARAQDLAKAGKGEIRVDGDQVHGTATAFRSTLNAGDALAVGGVSLRVLSVESDTLLHARRDDAAEALGAPLQMATTAQWKWTAKVDQSSVYASVWDELKNNGAIGIFPEGGSHDNVKMLPLKAGVALMALGAMVNGAKAVTIVPCGLNYFHGHRFRSRVIVEFGPPIRITEELIELYKTNKRTAISELLSSTREALENSLLRTADFETMKVLHMTLRLYRPDKCRLSPERYAALCHNFNQGHEKLEGTAEYDEMRAEVADYVQNLQLSGYSDEQVRKLTVMRESRLSAALQLLFQCVVVLLMAIVLAPGALLAALGGLPVRLIALYKANEALRSSTVKVKALDVIASWKLLSALIVLPIAYCFTCALFSAFVFYSSFFPEWSYNEKILLIAAWAILYPIISFISSIRLKSLFRRASALAPLLSASLSASHTTHGKHALTVQRAHLVKRVRETVELLAPKVFPRFDEQRIIPKELLQTESLRRGKMSSEESSRSARRRHPVQTGDGVDAWLDNTQIL